VRGIEMDKKTKKFMKNTIGTGAGLMMGGIVMDKMTGSNPKLAGINKTAQGAMNLGAVTMTVGAAGFAMDSIDDAFKTKKKKSKR
jgi:hypothetical protein